jgi:GntP family gluconate:H+ symporter
MIILLLILSVVLIVVLTAKLNIHPFLALLVASLFFGLCAGMSFEIILKSIEEGFGAAVNEEDVKANQFFDGRTSEF